MACNVQFWHCMIAGVHERSVACTVIGSARCMTALHHCVKLSYTALSRPLAHAYSMRLCDNFYTVVTAHTVSTICAASSMCPVPSQVWQALLMHSDISSTSGSLKHHQHLCFPNSAHALRHEQRFRFNGISYLCLVQHTLLMHSDNSSFAPSTHRQQHLLSPDSHPH